MWTPAARAEPPQRRRLGPRRLGSQLRLLISAALLFSALLLGGHALHQQTGAARQALTEQAEALARNLAIGSEDALITQRLDVLEDLLLRAADFPDVMALQILDPRGQPLADVRRPQAQAPARLQIGATAPLPPPPGPARPQTREDDEAERLVAWHPVHAGSLLGWVRVEQSTQALQGLAWQMGLGIAAVGLLGMLLSGAALTLLLRRPLQALDEARRFAARLGRSAGQPCPLLPGTEETDTLARALSEASERLDRQHRTIETQLGELRRHRAELRSSHGQLSTLFSLSPDGLLGLDRADRVAVLNQAVCDMLGLPRDALLGCPLDALDAQVRARAADPADHTGLAEFFAAASGRAPSAPLRWRLAGPRPRVLALSGRLSEAADGADPDGIQRLLYLRDVTHETEVDRMKSEFLSTAAHELRTPMVSVHGYTELMLMREMPPERQRSLLQTVHRQSSAILGILDDLLDLARIDARLGQELQPRPLDLVALARDTAADFAVPAGREPPQLQLPEHPATVRGDPDKLQQVLRNLLSNAYKYSPEGGEVQLSLTTATGPDGLPQHGLHVRDHGLGLSVEQQRHIGERFWRADPSGKLPGTGLGLAIVGELLGRHGGRLSVDSAPGRGSVFSAWLPAWVEAPADGPGAAGPADGSAGLPAAVPVPVSLPASAAPTRPLPA